MMKIKNFKLVEKFKYFVIFPIVILITAIILLFTVGMNVGIDFAGGAIVKFNLGDYAATHQEVKEEAKSAIINEIQNKGFTVSSSRWSGDDNNVLELGLALNLDGKKINLSDSTQQSLFKERIEGTEANDFKDGLEKSIENLVLDLNEGFDEVIFEYDFVGASAIKLLKNALWATVVAVVVMLIYIIIRFTLSSGLSAIVCLTHDVLIMIALTTIFGVQVNTTFIAAVITIIGYSINATIIIFDRIREVQVLDSMKGKTDIEIANKSVNDTLSRTILTALTTLLTILVLAAVCALMGVSTMEEFALPIIFGLIAGTFSSVLLAPSAWIFFKNVGKKITKKEKSK
ncbi:MAG: protein translocase subunit SecF [Clostridia bacterium]|nr:protein translocase subunit SecF [Clostridia bacterium]